MWYYANQESGDLDLQRDRVPDHQSDEAPAHHLDNGTD